MRPVGGHYVNPDFTYPELRSIHNVWQAVNNLERGITAESDVGCVPTHRESKLNSFCIWCVTTHPTTSANELRSETIRSPNGLSPRKTDARGVSFLNWVCECDELIRRRR